MSIVEIILVSLALAMDAFAVSMSSGMCIKEFKIRYALKFGLYFGLFQLLMPLIGYFVAFKFADQIKAIDHWVAFILLAIIGGKMIYETFNQDDEKCPTDLEDVIGTKNMVLMAIATSIDAMAMGVGFALLRVNIWGTVSAIGIITFILSFAGTIIGNKVGGIFKDNAQRLGGVILIGIGLNILIEHLAMG